MWQGHELGIKGSCSAAICKIFLLAPDSAKSNELDLQQPSQQEAFQLTCLFRKSSVLHFSSGVCFRTTALEGTLKKGAVIKHQSASTKITEYTFKKCLKLYVDHRQLFIRHTFHHSSATLWLKSVTLSWKSSAATLSHKPSCDSSLSYKCSYFVYRI